jgi:thioredoxin reductase (NADPH)
VRLNTEVTDGHGIEHLDTLTLHDVLQDRIEQVPATALFILIGGVPRTQWLPGTVQTDHGYILTGRDVVRDGVAGAGWPPDRAPLPLETSVPGVFAVGDARYRSLKRVASAVGDGATAMCAARAAPRALPGLRAGLQALRARLPRPAGRAELNRPSAPDSRPLR